MGDKDWRWLTSHQSPVPLQNNFFCFGVGRLPFSVHVDRKRSDHHHAKMRKQKSWSTQLKCTRIWIINNHSPVQCMIGLDRGRNDWSMAEWKLDSILRLSSIASFWTIRIASRNHWNLVQTALIAVWAWRQITQNRQQGWWRYLKKLKESLILQNHTYTWQRERWFSGA